MALGPGSIAFVGFNADGADNLAFVVLEPIAAGTVIHFTDNEWTGTAFNAGEMTWSWTATSDVAAGTVVTMDGIGPNQTATSNQGTINFIDETLRDIANGDEIVYAYIGTPTEPTAFLAAIANDALTTSGGITLDGTGLVAGLTALTLTAKDADADVAKYNGDTSGRASFSDYLYAINNPANWITQDGGAIQSQDGTAPDAPFTMPAFTVDPSAQAINFAPDSLNVTQAEGNSDVVVFTFTVMRSGDNTTGAVDFTVELTPRDTNAADYGGSLPATITGVIADGEASATIAVNIAGDMAYEAAETFALSLVSVANASNGVFVGSDATATGTIANDDTVQIVNFAGAPTISQAEGDNGATILTFTVERSGTAGTVGDLSFSGTIGGTTNGADFGGSKPLTFTGVIPDGATSTTVMIEVSGDTVVEPDETIVLTITSAHNDDANTILGSSAAQTAIVANDDGGPYLIVDGHIFTGTITVPNGKELTVEHGGTIQGDVLLSNPGTVPSVSNSGTIVSGDTAIIANMSTVLDFTGGMTVVNEAGGLIQGADRAIRVNGDLHGSTFTIVNEGTIKSLNDQTIRLDDATNGHFVVENRAGALIWGESQQDDVMRVGSNTMVINAGTIANAPDIPGAGRGGDAVDFKSGTGSSLHNLAGGYIEASRHGVTGDRGVTVVNEAGGVIVGRNGSAVNIDSNGTEADRVFITNYGRMEGRSAHIADSDGDAVDIDGLLTLENHGFIGGLGHNGYHDGEPNVSEAIAIGGGRITNHAGGEIYGYGRAIQVDNSSNANALGATTIVNHGLIHGDGNLPTSVTPDEVEQFAERIRGGEAINLLGNYGDTLTNGATGEISGGVKMGGGNDTVSNDGLMSATGGSAVDLGDGDDLFVNRGTVSGDVLAGAGNDEVINVSTGRILGNLIMGDGNDKLGQSGYVGGDIDMGAGDDVVNLYIGTDLATSNVALGAGNDLLTANAYMEMDLNIDAGDGDDTVTTSYGDDTVLGGAGNDRIYTELGDDRVEGGEGDDYIDGGAGDDELIGGEGSDTLLGGAGDDVLDGGEGVDTADYRFDSAGVVVDLSEGIAEGDDAGYDELVDIENVIGGSGDDTLTGSDAINVLNGGAGNDTILAGAGDTVIGGAGDDEIEASAETGGPASIDGGEGDDTVRLTATSAATIATLGASTGVENLLVEEGTWSVAASDYSSLMIEDGAKVTSTIALNNDDQLSIETGGSLVAGTAITWSGGGDAVIDNAGRIEASSRVLNTVAGATGSLTFNNEGTVVGALTPQGTGHADAAITINNAGTIESAVNGRVMDFRNFDASGASAVINNLAGGVIKKIGGDDADVIRPGVDGVVNNWGMITVDVAGVDAIDFQSDTGGKVNNYAGGIIQGTKHAVTGDRAVTVVNSGTMIGANGSAVNIDNNGSEAEKVFITNNASGVMEGRSAETNDSDGDAIDIDGLAQILNYGRIAGMGAEGYHDGEPNVSEAIAIGGGSILNYGSNAVIYGYGRGIQVDNSSNANALGKTFINNEGLIQGDGHGPEGVDPEDAAQFDLRGNEAINLVGDYDDEILNQSTGRIVGGISMGGGNDRLNNSGSITATGGSAIDMGAGDDVVNLYIGTSLSGKVLLGTGNDRLTANAYMNLDIEVDGGDGDDDITTSFGNDKIYGGAGNDWLFASNGDDEIHGGDGDDTIAGELGNDKLFGGAGDDTFYVGLGNDVIDGGDGFDTLDLSLVSGTINLDFAAGRISGTGIGFDTFTNIENVRFGAGNDTVTGGNGDDGFDGGAGNDTLKGGAGDDILSGSEGNDTVDGGSGDDIVAGGIGNDELKGGSGDDEVDGGDGDDVIDGGSGDDIILAGLGDDEIDGGSGDDVIEGGLGDDMIKAGSGHDIIVFAPNFGHDTISDFKTTGSSSDILEFDADIFADFAAAIAAADQVGKDVVFTFDIDNTITLEGVQLASLNADDFRFV